MRTRPLPRTFRSGELAPWLDGITNEITQQGCRTLENFIVRKQGQTTRRPGTFFVNEVKDSADATVLVPVTIDDDSSYVLEIGDAYIRFYKNHARITYTGTTTIYEVTSPWSTGDVSSLRWCYIPEEKALLFACRGYTLRQLVWTADADWELSKLGILAVSKYATVDQVGGILWTDDFKTWQTTRLNLPDAQIATTPGGYILVADQKEYVSQDLAFWSEIAFPYNIGWNTPMLSRAIQGNENNEVIAIGSVGDVIYSTDSGLSWTRINSLSGTTQYHGINFDPIQGNWRIGGEGVTSLSYYSRDGLTWSVAAVSAKKNYYVFDLLGYNDLWVMVGQQAIYSASAVNAAWVTVAALGANENLYTVARSASNLWVSTGRNTSTGSLIMYRSDGGLVWSVVAPGIAEESGIRYKSLSWIHSKFILHHTRRNATYAISEDGLTWTSITETARIYNYLERPAIQDRLNDEWFDTADHYPHNLTYHEGRLLIGPTTDSPSTLWASKVNKLRNFYLGEFSDEGWSYKLASERNVDIQWMMGGLGGIVVGTRTAEGIMLGSQEEGITPNTAQFRWLSTFGSANIQPVRVNNSIVFIQRGGEIVRGYVPQANAYESPELTYFADHIGKGGLLSIDRQEDPQNLVYFTRTDGQMPALSLETGLVAWSRIKPASTSLSVGIVESIAVIPTSGAEDEVWQVVNRKLSAGTKRYIEYYDQLAVSSLADAHYVDCGVNPTSGTTFATVGGLTHLAGEIVDALIDGTRWVSGLTVAASGTIALAPYSGTNVHAGLQYSSYLQSMRGDYGSPWGGGAGLNKRTSELLVWVHDSSALAKFGPNTTLATETIVYPSSTTLVTDMMKINFPGQWDRENYLWCVITDPRPFTLVAMMPDSETGDR